MEKECPKKSKHSKVPEGYVSWHEWAKKKSKTHKNVICDGCGLWTIWKPRRKKIKKS